jgi:hypothetical protein
MAKSITDYSPKEQDLNKQAYRRWMDTWEDRIKNQPIYFHYPHDKATSWKEFRINYKEDVKESFLAGRGPGGAWEPFSYTTRSGEKQAWRFVEGLYSKEQIEGLYSNDKDKDSKDMNFKPSYERQYKGGIKSSYDPTNTFLKKVDPNKKTKDR